MQGLSPRAQLHALVDAMAHAAQQHLHQHLQHQATHGGTAARKPRAAPAPARCRAQAVQGHWAPQHACQHQQEPQLCDDQPGRQRRQLLLGGAALLAGSLWCTPQQADAEVYDAVAVEGADETITNLVYLDIAVAPRSYKTAGERTLGDKSIIPLDDAAPLGRIVLGLYGNVAPATVGNFLALVRNNALSGTVFSRVLPGEYIQAGQQGAYRMGQVEVDGVELQANSDLTSPAAFRARHLRPGTLSLSLAENDEDPALRGRANYRSTEFLITTGPGPVPRLDSANLVFGRVLQGMSVVSSIAQVPTFKPSTQSRQLNLFAQSIGDERAANVQRRYGKPLKAVIITGAGELPLPAELRPSGAATSSPASVVNTAAVLPQ